MSTFLSVKIYIYFNDTTKLPTKNKFKQRKINTALYPIIFNLYLFSFTIIRNSTLIVQLTLFIYKSIKESTTFFNVRF